MTRTYGRWAVVAGASEGLGRAYAAALAANGHDLVLVARRHDLLEEVAAALREAHGVEVRCVVQDLGAPDVAERLADLAELEIGVVVYNAAFAPIGGFLDTPLDALLKVVDVNVRGPLIVARTLAPGMRERGRGALVLMSSLVGVLGGPRIATYAASKAFSVVLAESLWQELAPVDVLVSCAGAVRTPGYIASSKGEAPGTLDPEEVVRQTLARLGRGPRVVPGWVNRISVTVLGWLGRRATLRIMARNTEELS